MSEPASAATAPEASPAKGGERSTSMVADLSHLLQGRLSMIVVKFAITVIAARIWKEQAIGIVAVAMVIPNLVSDAVDLGTTKSLPYLIGRSGRTLQEVTSTAIMMWVIVSAISVPVSIAVFFSPAMRDVPPFWGILAALSIPFGLFAAYARSYSVGVQRLAFFKHLTWSRDPTTLAVIVIGGYVLGYGASSDGWIRLLAELVGMVLAAVFGARLIRAHASLMPRWDTKLMKEMLGHSFKFGLGMWSIKLNYRIGLLMLGLSAFQIPAGEIGNYSRALVVAMMLWLFPGMLGTIVFSRGVNTEDPLGAARRAALIARVATIAGVPLAGALWIAAPFIMPLVYGPGFAQSGYILRIFIPGILTFFLARVFDADLSARGRPLSVMCVMAPIAVLNIVLDIVLIPSYGVDGAAWATTIGFVVGAAVLGVVFARISDMSVADVFVPRVSDFRLVAERLFQFAVRTLGRGRRTSGRADASTPARTAQELPDEERHRAPEPPHPEED